MFIFQDENITYHQSALKFVAIKNQVKVLKVSSRYFSVDVEK